MIRNARGKFDGLKAPKRPKREPARLYRCPHCKETLSSPPELYVCPKKPK